MQITSRLNENRWKGKWNQVPEVISSAPLVPPITEHTGDMSMVFVIDGCCLVTWYQMTSEQNSVPPRLLMLWRMSTLFLAELELENSEGVAPEHPVLVRRPTPFRKSSSSLYRPGRLIWKPEQGGPAESVCLMSGTSWWCYAPSTVAKALVGALQLRGWSSISLLILSIHVLYVCSV